MLSALQNIWPHPMYVVVYFLFEYNFTDQCHRVETQSAVNKYHIISHNELYETASVEKLTISHLLEKFPSLYGNWKWITIVKTDHHLLQ
jgi:hypothetical protein